MGEILRAAVYCAKAPSLFPRELHMLADIARNADDHSGPVLDTDGTVREARRGYVQGLGDPKDKLGLKANMLETRMFIFTGTGWIQPVAGPEHDGAYQLNVPRLQRLLDAAEAAMATGEPDADAIAEADRELPATLTRMPRTWRTRWTACWYATRPRRPASPPTHWWFNGAHEISCAFH